jgi:hypothetical protein
MYAPILDELADHKPKTLGQLALAMKDKNITFAQVSQAAMILSASGYLMAVQDDALIAKAKKSTDKLNACIMDKARGSTDITYLASPVSGGGVAVTRFQQLFLLSMSQGKKQSVEWAQFVWQILSAQGQRIIKDGKTLETMEENLAELTSQANEFASKRLPILKALQIA